MKEETREKKRIVVGWTLMKLFFSDFLVKGDWQLEFFKTPVPPQFYLFIPPQTHFYYYDNLKKKEHLLKLKKRQSLREKKENFNLNSDHKEIAPRRQLLQRQLINNKLSFVNFDFLIKENSESSSLKNSTFQNYDQIDNCYEILSTSGSEYL